MDRIEEAIFLASNLVPSRLTPIESWHQHLPFGYALVALTRPRVLVELGTHMGDSYCTFCQAVAETKIDTQCFAIDTWEGDQHVGILTSDILQDLRAHHDSRYSHFSELLQMTFDEAAPKFQNGAIDFLHIDGLHTEQAVRHDYETWLPKMSECGVMLFHDISVRTGDFGVHRLWSELRLTFPNIEFDHGNGLGILLTGKKQPEWLAELSQANPEYKAKVRQTFAALGERLYAKRHLELHRATHDELWIHIREYERLLADARTKLSHTWVGKLRRLLDLARRLRARSRGHP